MPQKRIALWPLVTVIVGILIVLVALPKSWKGWAPSFIQAPSLHLGLDLVGGTQLDFRISEEEINSQLNQVTKSLADLESKGGDTTEINKLRAQKISIETQKTNLVEAIRAVIERRINALGVSEATITPSYIGNEKHLLVECPGVVNTQECINVVGKTIQLEFKEELTTPTEDFKKTVRAQADGVFQKIQNGSTLQKEGQDLSAQLGVVYQDGHAFFKDSLPDGLQSLWGTAPGTIKELDGTMRTASQGADGQTTTKDVPGIFIAQVLTPLTQTGRIVNEAPTAFTLLSKSETGSSYAFHNTQKLDEKVDTRIAGALRSMKGGELKSAMGSDGTAHVLFLRGNVEQGTEEADVSHLLVAYKGATEAPAGVTRTKEEALKRAQDFKAQIDKGASFETLAKANSDGLSTKASGGRIGVIKPGSWPPSFEDAAFKLSAGQVSAPVETQYGYHLIKLNSAVATSPDVATYDDLAVKGANAQQRAEDIINRLKTGKVRTNEQALTVRSLFFSLIPSGWKDTALDGKHFRTASVAADPVTNIPVVQISFDEEGGRMFQDLTKNNVGKRIAIFVGGQLVSAPVVQQEISGGTAVITGSKGFDEAQKLAQDLNTGAIPAPIHLVGQYTIEATLGAAALQTSLQAALIGTLILMVYMLVIYRLLGLMADIALGMYAIMLFAILKLPLLLFTHDYVVLTLAGMAGIILSIGMAVDANVLVFERVKEELRKGKHVKTAVEASFKHAWPAIRDSNVSTIITCGILFIIGTSIIRGFAITLAMGVLLSMLTAIVITRWLLRHLARTSFAERPVLFGGLHLKKEEVPSAAEIA
jgi:protein-export membrane protein SecD